MSSAPIRRFQKGVSSLWCSRILLLLGAVVPPLAQAQPLRLEIALTNGPSLRLHWNSTPGTDYQLQRSLTNRLPGTANEWVPLPILRASNTVTVLTDPIGPAFSQRYYRLLQFTNGVPPTNPPPLTVSPVEAWL